MLARRKEALSLVDMWDVMEDLRATSTPFLSGVVSPRRIYVSERAGSFSRLSDVFGVYPLIRARV